VCIDKKYNYFSTMIDVDDNSLVFEFEKTFIDSEPSLLRASTQLVPGATDMEVQMQDGNVEVGAGEICKFFLKGSCTKGSACPYKHTRGERAVVCKHWLRALCKKGDSCEFLHEYDLSKMPECYFFSKFGECSNPECMYLHINPEDKMKECPWYARGFCKHGPRCRHKHVKRTACANYLIGFCPDGPACKFGHPKYELPKDDDNNNPNKKPRTPMICHKCGSVGHKAATCPVMQSKEPGRDGRSAPRPLETVTCFKCGSMGHYANHCMNKSNPRASPMFNTPQHF